MPEERGKGGVAHEGDRGQLVRNAREIKGKRWEPKKLNRGLEKHPCKFDSNLGAVSNFNRGGRIRLLVAWW